MSLNAQAIEQLLKSEGSGRAPDEHDETPESPEARRHRTELLAEVLAACMEAWQTGSEDLDLIAEKLGDGSRDVAWRLPYGDSGLLEFFLGLLVEKNLRLALQTHMLRLVGNSCADTDENRARVVEGKHLPTIIGLVKKDALIKFTIPVLYNVMVDYEPAQLLASQLYLNNHLMAVLTSPNLPKHIALIPYFCKILALLVSQDGESAVADALTPNILFTLALRAPVRDDVEDFTTVVSVAVAYLTSEHLQSKIIGSESDIALFLEAFSHANTYFDAQQVDDPDTAASLKQLRSSLLGTLADLSGNDSFSEYHSLDSTVAHYLLEWLKGGNPLLQSAACLALGNISRSDEAAATLLETYEAHKPLLELLSDTSASDPQLLHAAMSFLKNLAIPAQNKALLGDLLEPSCVPRIYTLDTLPQVQFSAISLTRLLLLNCTPNVKRVCEPLAVEGSKPDYEKTSVHGMLSLFSRSDAEPTRLEAARCIASVCRVFQSAPADEVLPDWSPYKVGSKVSQSDDEDIARREAFYEKHELEKALSFLVTQSKWPVLQSEGWFVLALMCRSKESAAVVVKVINVEGTLKELKKTVTSREEDSENDMDENKRIEGAVEDSAVDSELAAAVDRLQLQPQQVGLKQSDNMAKVNRENALVLCTELVRKRVDELPKEKLDVLEGLVREGSELVVSDRTKAA